MKKEKLIHSYQMKVALALSRIYQEIDKRFFFVDVRPEFKNKRIEIKGFVHFQQIKNAVLKAFTEIFDEWNVSVGSLNVLQVKDSPTFSQINVHCATVYRQPSPKAPIETQEVFGRYIRTYLESGGWIFAQGIDGYIGWIDKSFLVEKNPDDYLRWLNGLRCRFKTSQKVKGFEFPIGAEFAYDNKKGILLPNGIYLKVSREHLAIINPAKNRKRFELIKTAQKLLGKKYLWGGKTEVGIDCSGFVQLIYELNGISLPRDANQQVNVGYRIGHFSDCRDLLPGDIVFFMNNDAKIFHVGMSLGGKKFIHSSSKPGVTLSALINDEKAECNKRYCENYVMARRILV